MKAAGAASAAAGNDEWISNKETPDLKYYLLPGIIF